MRQLLAQSQTGIANQTDDVVVAGEQFDDALFAEANFPQAICQLGGGAELFDTDGQAGFDLIERAKGPGAG